jgi:Ca2+-dependent lipid-binding protein
LVVGAVVIVGGVVVGVGLGCYYAGKGAWWLGKKGAQAAGEWNEERERKNAVEFAENMKEKAKRREMKQKEIKVEPKVPQDFFNMSAEDTEKHVGLFTLNFGSASGLKNMDTIGKSDPYTKIYFTDCEGQKVHYFKTHTIDEDLNPIWNCEPITVHYFPGMRLQLKIYDQDPGRDELEGVADIPFSALFAQSEDGGDYKLYSGDLVSDLKKKKEGSYGTVKFSYAYISDSKLKLLPTDVTNKLKATTSDSKFKFTSSSSLLNNV